MNTLAEELLGRSNPLGTLSESCRIMELLRQFGVELRHAGETMETHVKTLGILHIVLASLGILAGLIVLLVFGGIAGLVGVTDHSEDARLAIPILGGIGGLIFFMLMTLSLPGIVVGIGLLRFRPWARILGIVLSVLDLIHVPLGTAVGIYGFWVLLSPETERLFRAGPSQPVPA